MPDEKAAYWNKICTTFKKDGAIVELEYGDVHRTTVGTITNVLPGGIEFNEAGSLPGRQLFVPFGNIDAMKRLPLGLAEPTPKAKAAGK